MSTKYERPTYKHDCEQCFFLGKYKNQHGDYDLYYCNAEPTVIARYGNEGAEYYSGIYRFHELRKIDQPLIECYKRAAARNFI